MLNDVYKGCMLIGNRFNQRYATEETDDWSASEECATVAKVTYEIMKVLNISMEAALDYVMGKVIDDGFRKVEDHMWDNYCRGFLAGEILGMPTEKNLELAEKAEERWIADKADKYGYYQEVLEEVKGERI